MYIYIYIFISIIFEKILEEKESIFSQIFQHQLTIFHSIREETREHRVHRFCIVERSFREEISFAETSCNLPTYINTMLRFAFRSPYEPLHCTSSRKMRERGADGAGPPGRGMEGGLRKKVES